jgi:YidC/Oxa1 family membrane protein insertase
MLLTLAIGMFMFQLFPPPDPQKQPPAAAGAKDGAKADAGKDGKAADGQPQAGDQAAPDAADQKAGAQPAAAPPGGLQIAAPAGETQFATIGSLDIESGYRMMVTLSSRGASIRRAELASPRYTDQHDWNGYLGELELSNVNDGVRVGIVGQGTPAALAKPKPIVAGDVITGIDRGKAGAKMTMESLRAALSKTEPGHTVTLQVRSGESAPEARTVRLIRRPFAVVRPEVDNYRMRGVEPPAGFVERPSLLMSLPLVNNQALNTADAKRMAELLEDGNWTLAAQDETSATFTIEAVPGLTLVKRYKIAKVPADRIDDPNVPGYHVQVEFEFENTGEGAQTFSYRLDGPTGMPIEGWWWAHKISRSQWFGGAGLRDIVVRFDGNPITQLDCPAIVKGEYSPMVQLQGMAFAGVDGQYFAAVLIPERKKLEEPWYESVEAIVATPADLRHPTFGNVTTRMTRLPIELAAGAKHADVYRLFLGPKRPHLLAEYKAANDPNYSLADLVYYGLALFGAVARMMLVILHFFYGIVGNYGIAIIMLTVLVRGAMFPLSYKQTKSMARMQALKPEMDKINEQYKTDMQKRSQAMQELYRKHQINPLAGCLPVFLQLPIFMGLYRSLMVDVELRQSPLFSESIRWCSNLAAPDMLWNWSAVMPPFVENFLGPYLNVLPLITVALFLVTQKMSMPEPTNEQAAMQQKMMKYMTVFIGFMFYKVASGLCLYFIASSLWGIAERKLLPKYQLADAAAGGPSGTTPGPGGKRPGDGGSPKTGPNGKPRTKRPRKVRKK